MKKLLLNNLQESLEAKQNLINNPTLLNTCEKVAKVCILAFKKNKKVFFCGNGGSAADAQHLAAELSGRFSYDRPPLYSDALHVNSSYLTAVANDYSYEKVYARLIEGFGQKGDVLICLTTSGNSKNILAATHLAKKLGITTIGMTGKTGGKLKKKVDYLLNMPSNKTPRIQELHMIVGHTLCEIIESTLFPLKG